MSTVIKSARKALVWLLAIVMGLYALLAGGVIFGDAQKTPGLALDLAGGLQIILQADTTDGQAITESDLQQAVEIIRRRIDATGVAEAEISTQGTDTIVVGLPGTPDPATVDLVQQSAQLQFRPVIYAGSPLPAADSAADPSPSPTVEPTPGASPSPGTTPEPTPAVEPLPEASASPAAMSAPAATEPAAEPTPEPGPTPTPGVTDPSSFDWLTDELFEEYQALDCTLPENRSGVATGDPDRGHVACHIDGSEKYALGPVELSGENIATASSGPELDAFGNPQGSFAVRLVFTGEGGRLFNTVASRLFDLETPRNRFAMVLDGGVISAPTVQQRNFNGEAQITGGTPGFAQTEAQLLANQLKFGALPLTLELQGQDQVTASLGAEQLQRGLLAGAIGLLLVFVYSLLQYRTLGLVTIASLVIAALLS